MSTPASIKGHPIHTMLVPLPIGLWIFAFVADVMTRMGGGPSWRTVAFYTIGGGVVGALLAAAPGLIDLLSLRPGTSRQVGVWHMSFNLLAVAVFTLNFVLRWQVADHAGPFVLTVLGVAMIAVSGWLGGEMVYLGGVGVTPTAEKSPSDPAPRVS